MTIIVILLIVVAAILIIGYLSKQTKAAQKSDEPHIGVEVEYPSGSNDKGTMTMNTDGSVTLCTGKKSHVTLIGASRQTANEIINICDNLFTYNDASKKVGRILMENGIQIKEVEEFCSKVRPLVESRVKELVTKDPEWESLGDRDKEDKENEYRSLSMVEFGEEVTPVMSGALSFLTFNQPVQVPLLTEIVTEYGGDNVDTYCQYFGRKNPIIKIPDATYRKPLEELVKVGLAYTGKDMSVEELLSTLTLAELNEIASTDTKFTRKDKAIKFLEEKDNIASIIDKSVTLRSLFSLRPLPDKYREFDIAKYTDSQCYYGNLADVLVSLYKGYSPMDYK